MDRQYKISSGYRLAECAMMVEERNCWRLITTNSHGGDTAGQETTLCKKSVYKYAIPDMLVYKYVISNMLHNVKKII